MSPPRKASKRSNPEKPAKEVKSSKSKQDEHVESVKLVLTPKVGWTAENFSYLKTVPAENIADDLYAMFGIPLEYKDDKTKSPYHVFVEFNQSSFQFAKQFQDTTKAISIIAILTDYISSIPAYSSAKEAFSVWIEKATGQLKSLDFTPNEEQAVLTYLNKNVRANSHILQFVLTKESVEGINLYRTVIVEAKDMSDAEAAAAAQKQSEFEQQQRLLEQAMKEKKEAEEKQRQAELAVTIEQIVTENFSKIQSVLEQRNEALVSQILELEAKIDNPKSRK